LTLTTSTTILNYGSNDTVSISSTTNGGSIGTPVANTLTIGSVSVYQNTQQSSDTPGSITVSGSSIASLTGPVFLSGLGTSGGKGATVNIYTSSGTVPFGSTGNQFQVDVSGDSGGGDAGTFNLYGGAATVSVYDGGAINASAFGSNGKGGAINLNSGTLAGAGASNACLFATGYGSGKGGAITINSSGTVPIGNDSASIALCAGPGATGDSGTIHLSGSTVNLDGDALFVAPTSGKGATVKVDNTSTLSITNTINANGATNGSGGLVDLTATTAFTLGDEIHADGAGSGDGGAVKLNNAPTLDLRGLAESSITAHGGPDGIGGVVIVQSVASFNVNRIMNVSAGANVLDTSKFDGSIQLNSVNCQQWLTSYDWPTSYWNCVH
ncbi:MAG: hypothetical protein ACRD3W_25420, partial [Terriglobales bacterium]